MSIKTFVFFSLLFLCFAAQIFAFGNKEKKTEDTPPKTVQVTGTVRLVGNANFPELIISNSDNVWYIAEDEAGGLFNYQQRTISVEGEETTRELTLANGRPAGTRRELRNVKILSVAPEPPPVDN